ncbi:hypothetical protein [Flavobacterium nitrogenifigens]|nr:hypothetical protein [Flavobacterium nitrogenifigens]KAF2333415.1 hypothetical protein DM397_09765 [Flavobacterium nitrogenifigens]
MDTDNKVVYTTDIKYDGNKIISATDDDGFVLKYTYTGDQITKVEEFQSFTVLSLTTEYTYLNGKLNTEIKRFPNETHYFEIKYTYNEDGTISCDGKGMNLPIGQSSFLSEKYTLKNGNVVKIQSISNGQVDGTSQFEYDVKKNPMINILGMNLLIRRIDLTLNNTVKVTTVADSSTKEVTYSYLYNNDGFPTEQKRFDGTKLSYTMLYTY